MTDRASCWSLTINNPTERDMTPTLPAGWSVEGQIEEGKEGTTHYQAMLKTPQVRFSAVKKVYPRAHIEIARNRTALQKYVHKDETRVAVVESRVSEIPTLFDYQHTIASRWDDDEYDMVYQQHVRRRMDKIENKEKLKDLDESEVALEYVDILVERDIERGVCGVEYIAINPMWRSAWKRFYKSMVARERSKNIPPQTEDRQTDNQELNSTVE